MTIGSKFRPIELMMKAAGAQCNLRCDYCYYLDKLDPNPSVVSTAEKYQNDSSLLTPSTEILSESLLERYIQTYIEAQPDNLPIRFIWHGGEALLRPIEFYEKALRLQEQYAGGHRIENILQTNGIMLNQKWCEFFASNEFLIGISIDGNEKQHNAFRKGLGKGGTFSGVMRGINLLNTYEVAYNILSTVNRMNADEPHEYYEFIRQLGTQHIQFTPIVERVRKIKRRQTWGGQVEAPRLAIAPSERQLFDTPDVEMAPYSVTSRQWGYFLTEVFDSWVRRDVGSIFVQLFENTLANWCGLPAGLCTLAKECGQAGIVEANGDLFSCDHYVYPHYLLGNINDSDIVEMMNSPRQHHFGKLKFEALTEQCKSCEYLFACYGECPKNRFAYSVDGEPGHNYLCGGYYRFWKHVAPYMDYMKACLMQGLDPRMVMHWNFSND